MSDDIFDEIGRFDGEYTPEDVQRPGLDSLPDGTYEFQVSQVALARTPKSNEPILRCALKVLSGASAGSTVEKAWFFKTQKNINQLGADLCSLGFDADSWHGKRPFSQELKKALPKLKGMRFRARKLTEKGGDDKVYQNLYISGPLAANYTPPPPPSPTGKSDETPFSLAPFIPWIGTILAIGGLLA